MGNKCHHKQRDPITLENVCFRKSKDIALNVGYEYIRNARNINFLKNHKLVLNPDAEFPNWKLVDVANMAYLSLYSPSPYKNVFKNQLAEYKSWRDYK